MTTLVLEREQDRLGTGLRATALAGVAMTGSHGRPTLDDLVTGVWEGLSAHEAVACPACGGAMVPRYSAGPAAVGGVCRDCGAELA